MFGGASPSDPEKLSTADRLTPLRAAGGLRASFVAADGVTRLRDLAERGGYRLRFPATHAAHIEVTQLNTGGGVVGGDRLDFAVLAAAGTDVVVSTQAPERIYRAAAAPAEINIRLSLGSAARLDWLPQETLLYSGARLKRRFEIDITATSRLLMAEALTFGRLASGEVMGSGVLHDDWRIRRDGRLVFAEATRLDGDIAGLLDRPAIGGGARASALLISVAPDAADGLAELRECLAGAHSICGTSTWNGMLTARFLAADPAAVRRDLALAARTLARRPMPRVWQS